MDIVVLLIMMAMIAHDPLGGAAKPFLTGPAMLAAALGPFLVIGMVDWMACRIALARLRSGGPQNTKPLPRLEKVLSATRYATVAVFLFDLFVLGWLTWLRQQIGDVILGDELLAAAPALAAIVFGWSCNYPIDRYLNEEPRSDQPPSEHWPIGTRGPYLVSHFRHQMLLALAPMAIVLAWGEAVDRWVAFDESRKGYETPLVFGGFAVVLALTPLMIRYFWDTAPLPDDAVRKLLLEMCRQYGVRVRRLLLWRTQGGMTNGAVIGVVPQLRFILLTDGLMARMTPPEIEAVMAHELGHIRKRHLTWLIVCSMAVIYGMDTALREAARAVFHLSGWHPRALGARWEAAAGMAIVAPVVPLGLLVIAWISRRFERQADTFAVRHLTQHHPDEGVGAGRIGATAVQVYCNTLNRVSALNHCAPTRKSWRHGSIEWRCRYLEALVGTAVDRCPIDRLVLRICLASAALLVALIGHELWARGLGGL